MSALLALIPKCVTTKVYFGISLAGSRGFLLGCIFGCAVFRVLLGCVLSFGAYRVLLRPYCELRGYIMLFLAPIFSHKGCCMLVMAS